MEGWHLKREIQIGHLITTLTVAAAATMYITKLEQRIAIMEAQVVEQRARDQRQDESVKDAIQLLRYQLERMDNKLDKLIDRKP